jgi:hypothetical protein
LRIQLSWPNCAEWGKGMKNKEDCRRYIGEMAEQLANMARNEGFDSLAYLLEMAVLEAETAGATNVVYL